MKAALRVLSYPLLMTAAVSATIIGMRHWPEAVVLPIVCAAAAAIVFVLERVIPYDGDWSLDHDDVPTDVAHLVLSGALAEGARIALNTGLVVAATWLSTRLGSPLWPSTWHPVAQMVLALFVAELGGYWFHRLEHNHPLLWRIHSVHHSPTRLYWLNSFRFHPLDLVASQAIAVGPLVLMGATPEALTLYGVYTIVHTTLHHSNVDARLGPLNVLFAMAEVHRWHHSTATAEANANYCSVLSIWDWVFGTRRVPTDREPRIVGLDPSHASFPQDYVGQLKVPFDGDFWRDVQSPNPSKR